MLYRDIGACVGAHARESNSTSDTSVTGFLPWGKGRKTRPLVGV